MPAVTRPQCMPAIAEDLDDGAEKGVDLMQVYPLGFTFFCALIFVMPIVKCLSLAFDTDVRYWMGFLPMVVAMTPPVFIVLAYFVNRIHAGTSKTGTILALIGSGIAMVLLGDQLGAYAGRLADRFGSLDCRSNPGSFVLEKELTAAALFHQNCVDMYTNPTGYVKMMQDCPGYTNQLYMHEDWSYLSSLEMRFGCTGWCEARKPLWNFGAKKADRCSVAVGEKMREKVQRACSQLLVWSLCLVALTSVAIALLLPAIRNAGLDW